MATEYCDKHPSVPAKTIVTLPSGGRLAWCGHCAAWYRSLQEDNRRITPVPEDAAA